MSWPIGYGESGVKYSATGDGTILADGVPVTSADGWLHIARHDVARRNNGPESYSLRLRATIDRLGRAFFHAEEVEVGGTRYSGLYSLARTQGGDWLSEPVVAARSEIRLRRRAGALLAQGAPTSTRSMRSSKTF